MYGTLSRLYPRQGEEQAVLDHLFRWEQEYLPGVTGYARGCIFLPCFFVLLLSRGLSPLRTAMSSKRITVSKRREIRQREVPEAKKEYVTRLNRFSIILAIIAALLFDLHKRKKGRSNAEDGES